MTAMSSLRLPKNLLGQLRKKASGYGHSINTQLIHELAESFSTLVRFSKLSTFGLECTTTAMRLPVPMREQLERFAKDAGHSFNAECIARLSAQLSHQLSPLVVENIKDEIVRSIEIAELTRNAEIMIENGGGLAAVVGRSGYGKTQFASQYVRFSGLAASYFSSTIKTHCFLDTTGSVVAFIDEPQQFAELPRILKKTGIVWVLLCQTDDQFRELGGIELSAVISLNPWTALIPDGDNKMVCAGSSEG